MNATTITIGECRGSYVSILQPKPPFNAPMGEPKYSMTVLVPKTNTQAKAAMDAAVRLNELRVVLALGARCQ